MEAKYEPLYTAYLTVSAPLSDGSFDVSPESRKAATSIIDQFLKDNPDISRDRLFLDFSEREHWLNIRTEIPDIDLGDGEVLPGTRAEYESY